MKFTTKNISALMAEEKEYSIFDEDNAGFGIRVFKSGVKSYIYKYLTIAGKQKLYTIGRVNKLTLKQARDEYKKCAALVVQGIDPQKEKSMKRNLKTIAELTDNYIKVKLPLKKKTTQDGDLSRINRHILPLLKDIAVKEINKPMIVQFYDDVAVGKTAKIEKTKKYGKAVVTGGHGTAKKAFSLLSSILTYAVEIGEIGVNPAIGLKLGKDNKKEYFLDAEQYQHLFNILTDMEEAGSNQNGVNVLKLLMLTGARKSEILNLKWKEIDLPNSCLRLSDSKTGAKVIYLSSTAVDLISGFNGNDSEYVFPGLYAEKPFQGLQKIWVVAKEKAGLKEARIHDLRHSFASFALAKGVNVVIIGKLLGHKNASTTLRYTHVAEDAAKEAVESTSDHFGIDLSER